MDTFGKRLKYLREKRELTQQKLAELLSVNRDALAKWETDKALPDINMVRDIAQFYQVSADYLIGKDDQAFETRVTELILKNKDVLGPKEQEFLLEFIANYLKTVKNRKKIF